MNKIRYNGGLVTPSKVVCVGRNYVDHIQELQNDVPGEMVLFIKPNSAITEQILLPSEVCRFEGEISFLMQGQQIVGVGFGIDLTLPEVQNRLKSKGLPWEKAKSFNNSAVFSAFVECRDDAGLSLELWVNGELRQKGGIELMIHKPAAIFKEITQHFTLEDYDVVMTGTPAGVGELQPGDRVTGKILSKDVVLVQQEWVVNGQ